MLKLVGRAWRSAVQDLLKTPPKLAQAVQNAAQPIVTSATSSAAAALSGRRLL